jgi:hypothetical protein
MEAIADGRIQPANVPITDAAGKQTLQALGPDPLLSQLTNQQSSQPEIKFQTVGRRSRHRRPARLPVLAGEITALLRGIHGPIADDLNNRSLIRQDASRRVRAYRSNNDLRFKDMREHDMNRVISWASTLFWLKNDVEEEIDELFSSTTAIASVSTRNQIAARLRVTRQE